MYITSTLIHHLVKWAKFLCSCVRFEVLIHHFMYHQPFSLCFLICLGFICLRLSHFTVICGSIFRDQRLIIVLHLLTLARICEHSTQRTHNRFSTFIVTFTVDYIKYLSEIAGPQGVKLSTGNCQTKFFPYILSYF